VIFKKIDAKGVRNDLLAPTGNLFLASASASSLADLHRLRAHLQHCHFSLHQPGLPFDPGSYLHWLPPLVDSLALALRNRFHHLHEGVSRHQQRYTDQHLLLQCIAAILPADCRPEAQGKHLVQYPQTGHQYIPHSGEGIPRSNHNSSLPKSPLQLTRPPPNNHHQHGQHHNNGELPPQERIKLQIFLTRDHHFTGRVHPSANF
jgi:hypothetical protein